MGTSDKTSVFHAAPGTQVLNKWNQYKNFMTVANNNIDAERGSTN